MATDTLELVELESLLDDSIACYDCLERATHVRKHDQCALFLCVSHIEILRSIIVQAIMNRTYLQCLECPNVEIMPVDIEIFPI